MAQKSDRENRNVGMQGFKYSPEVKGFAHRIDMRSPSAYRFIRDYLPLPTEEALRYVLITYIWCLSDVYL
jgi:hypothetical protein